ncbi:TRAP-type C4-dicarboxylate transport system, substrate-binding protein [Ruaniaceae bacterium KH17]|nr:TRAP-type C4-dicarboxylate transport system, substrate-binding protein [Ruaniaceae bacterium KH17]
MKKLIRFAAATAVAALALSACGGGNDGGGSSTDGGTSNGGGSGESITINTATMVQPNTPSAPVVNWFYDELEARSDGRISVDRTEPETICKAPEIAECVRDGRVDLGVSISDYSAQVFPSMTVATIPFMADNSQALMQSIYKVNKENAAAVEQWENAGIELVAAWGPGKLILGSNARVQDINDIDGVRFRVTGQMLQRAFDEAGANVVALPANETYEAIERGIADAVAWTMDGPVDYKLMEQLDTWTDPGVGHYTTFAIWMNKDFYDGMPDDLRAIVDEVRDELNGGAGMEQFNARTEGQCTTLLDFPKTESFTAWDEAATAEWKDAVQETLIEEWITQAEADGLADARGYLADYRAALEEASAQPDIVEDAVSLCIARAAGN